jgi:hypothetical protein
LSGIDGQPVKPPAVRDWDPRRAFDTLGTVEEA